MSAIIINGYASILPLALIAMMVLSLICMTICYIKNKKFTHSESPSEKSPTQRTMVVTSITTVLTSCLIVLIALFNGHYGIEVTDKGEYRIPVSFEYSEEIDTTVNAIEKEEFYKTKIETISFYGNTITRKDSDGYIHRLMEYDDLIIEEKFEKYHENYYKNRAVT